MTDWLTATAMVLSGLIVGFMFIYGMKRRDEKSDLERKDLEAKRDALIAQLRSENDPAERGRLELEAAAVLKKLDEKPSAKPGVRPGGGQPPPAVHRSSAAMGFLYGAGSVAIIAAIAFFVMQSAKPKEESQPAAQAPMQQQPQNDALVQQLEASVQKNPTDLNARIDLAKAYLDRENMTGVVEQTQYVLQRSPNDARALTYEALVRIANGQGDAAKTMLERATKSDPDLIDAWVGLAWVNAQAGRFSEAEAAIGEAKRRHPDQAERLDALMQHIKPSNPIRITLNVAPGAAVPANGVIYVMARAVGQTSGPPIAVKRIALGAFPVSAEISSADSMSGEQLPEKVHIDVRLDTDGNAMTKSPGDLSASQDGVAVGQAITLTLR
jgi:cytochrome c-type biogenesis protein CcmH/NrfG